MLCENTYTNFIAGLDILDMGGWRWSMGGGGDRMVWNQWSQCPHDSETLVNTEFLSGKVCELHTFTNYLAQNVRPFHEL